MTFIAGYELTWAARQYREREALVFGERRLSFTEVNRRGNRFANALRGLGLDKNQRVAVLLNNSIESLDTVFGAAKAGVTYVALNARHPAAEQRQILEDAEPTVIVAGPEFEEVMTEAAADLPGLEAVFGVGWSHAGADDFETLVGRADDREPGVEVEPEDLMRLHYTSGTTGQPKGILYTHRRYYDRQNNFFTALEYGLGVDDAMIHVGPLTHAAGNYLMPYYLRGARNIVMPRFDAGALQATVERERVTSLLLVPTMLIRLLEELEPGRYDLSSVGRINYGTAPMPVDTLRQGMAVFGPVFREHYGLSECPQPTTLLHPWEHVLEGPEHEVRRLASCGRPTLNINLRIHDAEGRPLPPGEIGEIVVEATGAAAVDYWRRPELRDENIRDGWLQSGDLGWQDEDDYLFIVGRSKDMIISGGFNVYCREVEEALHAHADIVEAAVVGLPDTEWGEIVCAVVVPRLDTALSPEAVAEHCRQRIAGYKKPRLVEFAEALPRNATGKVDKNELRRIIVQRHPDRQAGGEGVGTRYQ